MAERSIIDQLDDAIAAMAEGRQLDLTNLELELSALAGVAQDLIGLPRESFKAELEQQYKPSDSNARKVEEEKVKAKYDVAKEKCEDLKGDAKSACEKQAKADETKAKADIKAMHAKK